MVAIRSLVVAIAVLGTSTLGLAAPSDTSAIAHPEERAAAPEAVAAPLDDRNAEDEIDDDTDLEAREALDNLLGTRAACYTTSKRGKNCHQSQCTASECKVSKTGKRCEWVKKKKSQRPFACNDCQCAKFSS